MNKIIGLPGSQYDSNNAAPVRTNRTGGAALVGGAYVVDLHTSATESTTIALGQGAVVPVTTALIAAGQIVIARETTADDADGRFVEGEGVECDILVESTTDIAKGDALKPVNAQAYLVKATVGTDRFHAIALEARTANDTGLIRCLLYSSGRR